jgi:dsDNA-binding SOS-regulon protein
MNVNVFGIPNFDKAHVLARKSDGTLPGSVRDNLSDEEEKRLLEIIEEFEKSPTDLKVKKEKYAELMKLFYKGIGLDEKGKGTISEKDQRAALELSGLINDAILQDQQNIDGSYNASQLKDALELQNKFRKDLEKTDFKNLLKADKGKDTEISAGQKEYQTEQITSYLAENKEDFTKIFQELSKEKPDLTKFTETQKEKLKNLKTLAGEKGQNILNTILSTFKDFKEYSFTNADLTKMKQTTDAKLLEQATKPSIPDNWERVKPKPDGKPRSKDTDNDTSTSRSGRGSCDTSGILEKILARLEKLENGDTDKDTKKRQSSAPGWLTVISGLADAAAKVIPSLINNNQDYCCYSPAPCYGGGGYQQHPICRRPYYVGGDTWPWGRANGINSEYSAFNNYMPSSGSYSAISNPSSTSSSNPYSSSSAYNPISISVNPVFNNSPTQSSSSNSYSGSRSSNVAAIRRSFGINT